MPARWNFGQRSIYRDWVLRGSKGETRSQFYNDYQSSAGLSASESREHEENYRRDFSDDKVQRQLPGKRDIISTSFFTDISRVSIFCYAQHICAIIGKIKKKYVIHSEYI